MNCLKQEQLIVVMRTVQHERGKICRTQILAGTSLGQCEKDFRIAIASGLVRANFATA